MVGVEAKGNTFGAPPLVHEVNLFLSFVCLATVDILFMNCIYASDPRASDGLSEGAWEHDCGLHDDVFSFESDQVSDDARSPQGQETRGGKNT